MKNLFDKKDLQELLHRIDQLNSLSVRKWGKMEAAQMLAHCATPIEVALGKRTVPQGWLGKLFGGILKKFMLNQKPFSPNTPTDASLLITDTKLLEQEKQRIKTLLLLFHENNGANIGSHLHPVFGRMTKDEWNIMTYKHLNHHLLQFSC